MKKTVFIFCLLFFPSFVHAAVSEFYYSFDRPPNSLLTHHYDTASRAASYNNGVLKLTIDRGMHGAKDDESKGVERAELIKEISFGQVNMSFKIRVGKNFKVTKRTLISQLKIKPNGGRSPIASVYLDKGGRVKCVSYTAKDQIQHIVPIKHVNITDGKWHKVLISVTPSYGSGKCSIFIDGKEVINVSDLTNVPNNSPKKFHARIGVYRDAQPFSQTVYFDDWKLESIPLKSQIQKHFENLDLESRKKFQSNLRGYGYTSKLDGIWGEGTLTAVLNFIENNDETMSEKPIGIVERIIRHWNYGKNCKAPKHDSIQILSDENGNFIRIQLRDGDIGNCPTDNDKAHSKKYNKPYSERAELTGKYKDFSLDESYLIKFKVRFVEGFNNSDLTETFFQIKDCSSPKKVPVMARLGKIKGVYAFKFHFVDFSEIRFITSNPVNNEWHDVKIYYYAGNPNRISIIFDGFELLNNVKIKDVLTCGKPTLRLGIYRSGNTVYPNSHSIVDYKNIGIEKMKDFPNNLKVKTGLFYVERNYFCFNDNYDDPKVYTPLGSCNQGHLPISSREYFKIKKIIEE